MRLFKTISLLFSAALTLGIAQANQLTILHINDHHSHLRADGRMSLNIGGNNTRVRSGGFPAIVSTFDKLSEGKSNVLRLHAGDAITGDLYYTLFKGEADAALMNEVCFDAFALGNHEFDDGDAGLANFLDFLNNGDCQTPILAANISPEVGVSPLTKNSATDYIQPFTVINKGGMKIGIIGIDIATKTKNSSSPDESTLFLDETETAQKYIDELAADGVNHIILLTHYQYQNDLKLAENLRGVDIIVGGDSHTLLGDFKDLGLNSKGPYPTMAKNADGEPVCVVQAWQYSQIVGELNVDFSNDGVVETCDGLPHMMLGDSFKRKNADGDRVEIEGTERQAVLDAINADPKLHLVKGDTGAEALLAGFSSKVDELKAAKIGNISEDLCLERIPGQGKSKLCDVSQTSAYGSDISNLVSHAFRDMARTSDIAIQNAGGVREDVPAGDFTIGDAYKLLPFSNTLVELKMSGEEIKNVLEDALDYALNPEGSTGAYPYAAGVRWHVDVSKDKGFRFTGLEFKGPKDGTWTELDMDRIYTVVTNNYISSGRDGYLTFGTISKEGRVTDTYLDYAQSFVDYVRKVGTVNKLDRSDYSTQSFKK
ncbi:MAG: NAD nucleotidase [Rhodospirillales bacterium]|tara:strand:+ start:386 stop:2179 length:1794 start_codon:yes stop_codon:yes gene_type:complete